MCLLKPHMPLAPAIVCEFKCFLIRKSSSVTMGVAVVSNVISDYNNQIEYGHVSELNVKVVDISNTANE